MTTRTKTIGLGTISLLLMGTLLAGLAGCSSGPEGALADHVEEIADIMKDNTENPKDGLEELRDYMRANLPEIMQQIGIALVELDECDSDEERRERIGEMQEELGPAIDAVKSAAGPFMQAVMQSQEAGQYLADVQASMESIEDIAEGLGLD